MKRLLFSGFSENYVYLPAFIEWPGVHTGDAGGIFENIKCEILRKLTY